MCQNVEGVRTSAEFNSTLKKLISGNMTLVDELGSMQLAIQAAISNAFKTPEVIRMFAKKQPGQLREKLSELERDAKIGKLSQHVLAEQKIEILFALKKLGDSLNPSELNFLQHHSTASMREFESVSSETGTSEKVLEAAASQLKAMKRIKCYGCQKVAEIKLEKSWIRKFFDGDKLTESLITDKRHNKMTLEKNVLEEDKENVKNFSIVLFETPCRQKRTKPRIEVKILENNQKKPIKKKQVKEIRGDNDSAFKKFVEPRWSDIEKHELFIEKQGFKSNFKKTFKPQNYKSINNSLTTNLNYSSKKAAPKSVSNAAYLPSNSIFHNSSELIDSRNVTDKNAKMPVNTDSSKVLNNIQYNNFCTVFIESQTFNECSIKKLSVSKYTMNSSQNVKSLKNVSNELEVNVDKKVSVLSASKSLSFPYGESADLFESFCQMSNSEKHKTNVHNYSNKVTKSTLSMSSPHSEADYLTLAGTTIAKKVITSTPVNKPNKRVISNLFNVSLPFSPCLKELQDCAQVLDECCKSQCIANSRRSSIFSNFSLETKGLLRSVKDHTSFLYKTSKKSLTCQNYKNSQNTSLNETSSSLSKSVAEFSSQLPNPEQSDELTKKDLLKLCNQEDVEPFENVYNWKNYKIQKIGEGTYGEVFMISKKKSSVLKIIPIPQNSDADSYQGLKNVLLEVKITKCLSDLRNNRKNQTKNFIKMNRVSLVSGQYPSILIDAWDAFVEEKSSYNARPDVFDDNQLYIVLELAYGGKDMTCFELRNATEAESVLKQVTMALAVAEEEFLFEHRDLHLGNILVQRNTNRTISFKLKGQNLSFESCGLHVSLIDFTLSRLQEDGYVFYNDLAQDVSLFNQSGDIQFDIYRCMKEKLKNQWHECSLYSNVLWLNFLCIKMKDYEYSRPSTLRIHKKGVVAVERFKDGLNNCNCAVDCLKSCVSSINF